MNIIAGRAALLLCTFTFLISLIGCPSSHKPATAHPGLYAMPATTSVELLEPCRLLESGQPAEPCKFRLHINVVEVKK